VFFLTSKVFWLFAEPGNALTVLIAGGAALTRVRRWRWASMGRFFARLGMVALVLIAFTPLSLWIARPLEDRFPHAELPERVDGVVMLGGAVSPPLAADRGEPSINDAAERLFAFIDLGRRYPNAKLVFSGGSGSVMWPDLKEEDPVRGAFRQAGFDDARVVFENRSRNTWENAVNSKELAGPKPGETWLLVTSAMHMPRSVGIFRAVGWNALPVPVDYRTMSRDGIGGAVGMGARLVLLSMAVREWIGLAVYRVAGQSSELFPGP
jgi:uncharacterized SAM-binding protein YcdF (DUF218 family)